MTKLAFAGDWHGNTRYAIRMCDYAKENGVSKIFHVGDFAYDFTDPFLFALTATLRRNEQVIYFVAGNHDNYDKLATYQTAGSGVQRVTSRIYHLPRGYRWDWEGTSFLALGGAFSVDKEFRVPGVEWWWQEKITEADKSLAMQGGHADIMITHDVPAGVEIPSIRNNPMGWPAHILREADEHRHQLRQVVDVVKPGKIYAGHYHCRQETLLRGDDYTTLVNILDCDGTPPEFNMTFATI